MAVLLELKILRSRVTKIIKTQDHSLKEIIQLIYDLAL